MTMGRAMYGKTLHLDFSVYCDSPLSYVAHLKPSVTMTQHHRDFYSILDMGDYTSTTRRTVYCDTKREAIKRYKESQWTLSMIENTPEIQRIRQQLRSYGVQGHRENATVYTFAPQYQEDVAILLRDKDFPERETFQTVAKHKIQSGMRQEYLTLKRVEDILVEMFAHDTLEAAQAVPYLQAVLAHHDIMTLAVFHSQHVYEMQESLQNVLLQPSNPSINQLQHDEKTRRVNHAILQAVYEPFQTLNATLQALPLKWTVLPMLDADTILQAAKQALAA